MKSTDSSDIDQVEEMLKRTGCINLHYKVQVRNQTKIVVAHFQAKSISSFQECIAETQDWRKCQHVVKEFRECMTAYTTKQLERNKDSK